MRRGIGRREEGKGRKGIFVTIMALDPFSDFRQTACHRGLLCCFGWSMSLTGKQKRHLRSLAQTLKPAIHLGKNGVTEAAVREITRALQRDELVKVKLQEADRADRAAQVEELVRQTGAELAGIVGGSLSLYLAPQPDPDRKGGPKIRLPKVEVGDVEEDQAED